ncbi:MAG: hypothetical protein UW69_C0083G0004 [Microgenomates group bacterium GW2011_GWA2_44_7]|nr:MAG: hypothetical protein UW69_C0083G0004 [Microgenomates group bacterium GW2011_GWA2_44_7]
MDKIKRIRPSETYLKRIEPLIFGSLKRAEHGIFIWFPTGAKSTSLLALLSLIEKKYDKYLQSHLIFYIDASSVPEPSSLPLVQYMFAQMTGKNLTAPSEKSELTFIHEIFKPYLLNLSKKKHVSFIVDKLEVYPDQEIKKLLRIFDYLQAQNRGKILFQLHVRRHRGWPEIAFESGMTSLVQNIHYVSLPTEEEAKQAIDDYLKVNNKALISSATLKTVMAICGTHPMLLRSALRLIERGVGELSSISLLASPEILERARLAWLELGLDDQEAALKVLKGEGVYSEAGKRLLDIGFFRSGNGQLDVNGIIFRQVARISQPSDSMTDNLIKDIQQSRFLSPSEKRVLELFIKNQHSLCSRDMIAEAIWGNEALGKFSNWAIDRVVSRLRSKLPLVGLPEKTIETLRGKGYRWVL